MEDSGVRSRHAAQGNQGDADRRELFSTKPLHRFVQKEPKSLGVVLLMFGCTEVVFGFLLGGDEKLILRPSNYIYTPYWQGALFIICGVLSIYSGIHPSKKMITVCLSMYVVSLVGVIVSSICRIITMTMMRYYHRHLEAELWFKQEILTCVEALLFLSSLCVFGLLIFLCVIARLALKSTRTQIVLQQIPPPVTETPTEET